MLLRINRIYTWTYSSALELVASNCTIPALASYQSKNDTLFSQIAATESLPHRPLILSDGIGLMWICLAGDILSQPQVFLLGPVLPADAQISGITKQMQMNAMGRAQQEEVLAFLSTVPTISLTNIFQYAVMLAYTLNNEVCSISEIQMPSQKANPLPAETNEEQKQDARGNYAFQSFYLKLVEDGNLHYKELLNNYEAIGTVGKLSNRNALQNAKNTGIATVALCGRAAMQGGLPPETAYSMSDYYIQAIDSAKTITEVYAYNSEMLDDYIHKVNDYKALYDQYSKIAADADAYIDLHLTEEISIESIARVLGYSKYYFSAAFKNSTGKPVNEYIRDKRLAYAKMQLLSSDEKIAHLSERLHFISPSYFTKCFKEFTGMTPNAYRNALSRCPKK